MTTVFDVRGMKISPWFLALVPLAGEFEGEAPSKKLEI
jgi:hypothetical protein